MAYAFTQSWSSGYALGATDSTDIQADIATRGDNLDFAHYGAPNCAFLTLVPGDLPANSYTVTAASWSGGTVTLTVSASHNIQVGQHFSVSSITPTGYNSTDAVATSGTTGTTIKYAVGSNPGTYVSGGTVLVDRLSTPAAGMVAIDQGGNLRWYNINTSSWLEASPVGLGGAFSTLQLTSSCTEYDGITTAGIGLTPILAYGTATNQSASVGTSTVLATPAAGLYRFMAYMDAHTTGAGSVTISVDYTDVVGSKTTTSGSLSLAAANEVNFNQVFWNQAGDTISFFTTYAGPGAYDYYWVLERLA
jgi:hypothetical protein